MWGLVGHERDRNELLCSSGETGCEKGESIVYSS